MMEPQAAEAIRSLIARNAAALNDAAGDPTPELIVRWVATFAPDGAFELAGRVVRGREALEAFHSAVVGVGRMSAHVVGQSELAPLGERRATGRTDFILVGRDRTGFGRYEDEFVSGGDGWRIAHRRVVVPGGASPSVLELAERHSS